MVSLFSWSHLYQFCKIKVVGNPYLLAPTSSHWRHLHLSYLDSYLCEQVRSILQGVSKYLLIHTKHIKKKKEKKRETSNNYSDIIYSIFVITILYIYIYISSDRMLWSWPWLKAKDSLGLCNITTPPWNTILETLISVSLPWTTWQHLPPLSSWYLIISCWKMLLIIIIKSVGRKALKLNHRRKQTPAMPVMDLVMQPPPPPTTCKCFFLDLCCFFSLNKKMVYGVFYAILCA